MENKEFQTLIVSIAIHVFLAWLIFFALPKWMPLPVIPEAPIEISVIDKNHAASRNDKKSKAFVEETEQENLDDQLRTQADILSRLDRRVREQMKAHDNGDTQNRGRGNTPIASNPLKNLRELAPDLDEDRVSGTTRPQQMTEREQQLAGVDSSGGIGHFQVIGNSSISEHIPGIKEGAFTALNTDQFLFYSFFARVNRELRSRWVANVRSYTDSLPLAMLKHLAQSPSITDVEIVLDNKGEYIKAIVHRPSGDANLDQAAVAAFKDAAPFQNPPIEMVEKDNTVRLHYTFYIEWQPQG